MYLSGPYHIALFDKEPGANRVEVVPAPAGPGGVRATLAGGELAFITKTTKRRADALQFIEFLISVPGQTLGSKPPRGGLPVVRLPVHRALDAGTMHQDPRWDTVAEAYLNQGKALPMLPNWARVQQVAADGFNSMLARCSTTLEADLKALNGKIDAELDKQRVFAR